MNLNKLTVMPPAISAGLWLPSTNGDEQKKLGLRQVPPAIDAGYTCPALMSTKEKHLGYQ
ncbi:hypothetical protein J6590_054760 [Homalodisca vitripennis]|nr:hypothetical protein J6590_054760 [Homalodisca vitripennis]